MDSGREKLTRIGGGARDGDSGVESREEIDDSCLCNASECKSDESQGVVGKSKSLGESVRGDEEFEKDRTGVVSVAAVVADGFSRVVDSKDAAPIEDFSQNGS
jgi:hypothetical protein